ncbi:hypothetical protein [Streptomyces griseus]|uniref:hypothetical protein n=1 Tax=Streptomyces griseus TaxID=1911 RepID=UPI003667567B
MLELRAAGEHVVDEENGASLDIAGVSGPGQGGCMRSSGSALLVQGPVRGPGCLGVLHQAVGARRAEREGPRHVLGVGRVHDRLDVLDRLTVTVGGVADDVVDALHLFGVALHPADEETAEDHRPAVLSFVLQLVDLVFEGSGVHGYRIDAGEPPLGLR